MKPTENDLVVIDFPAAADHDENSDGIDPMHDAKRKRMKFAQAMSRGNNVSRHVDSPHLAQRIPRVRDARL
jgi:hypothetical protein